ncbi:hypothetical protein ACTXT7_001337 [Hymenolepis weldensis]
MLFKSSECSLPSSFWRGLFNQVFTILHFVFQFVAPSISTFEKPTTAKTGFSISEHTETGSGSAKA